MGANAVGMSMSPPATTESEDLSYNFEYVGIRNDKENSQLSWNHKKIKHRFSKTLGLG